MKKLLLYLVCAIVIVSCGVSIYYVVRNDEKIYSTVDASKEIYLNLGEKMDIPLVHENPSKKTKIDIVSDNESVEVDLENWSLIAKEPGTAFVSLTPSNTKFESYRIEIKVGNGSLDAPYYIRNQEDFTKIGQVYPLESNFYLTNDVTFEGDFSPIGDANTQFTGNFQGNGNKIINLSISPLSSENTNPCGLFSVVGKTGKVENLIVENANILANSRQAGIIAGRNHGLIGKCQILDSKISNSAPGGYEGAYTYTGIVAGVNESLDTYAQIRLCTVSSSVKSDYIAGGLVGWNKAGVINDNKVTVVSAEMTPFESSKDEYLFGGLVGRSTNSGAESSMIINNLVILNNINSKRTGGLFGIISTDVIEARGYYSMNLICSSELFKVDYLNINEHTLSSQSETARNYVANITNAEKNNPLTYTEKEGSTWDVEKIWTVRENIDIKINYDEQPEYSVLPVTGTAITISSDEELKAAIENMRVFPTAKIQYKIIGKSKIVYQVDENGDEVLDELGEPVIDHIETKKYTFTCDENFIPIGSKDSPFAGTIIAEDDAVIEFKNLTVDSEFAGIFGYLGQNANINNINVIDCNFKGTMVGGIAAYNAGGKINNCYVGKDADDQQGFSLGSTFNTVKYAGGIVGYNSGLVENSKVDSLNILVEEENAINLYLGGIAGKSVEKISNAEVNKLNVQVSFESEKNTICVGGIVGHISDKAIENSASYAMSADLKSFSGRTYFGGIAGYVQGANISSCLVEKGCLINLNKSTYKAISGGIAGIVLGGNISKSSVNNYTVYSHTAAGIVSFLKGGLSQSFVGSMVDINGTVVAGLSNNLYGSIDNCYSICSLSGAETESGYTTHLWKDSSITNCFTYCNYQGEGSAYAETTSNYKANPNYFGTISNSIIVGQDNQDFAKPSITDFYRVFIVSRGSVKKVEVQVKFLKLFKGEHNFISESELLSNAQQVFAQYGFDADIWSYEIGKSPRILNANVLGESFGYILESETEQDENAPGEDFAEQPEVPAAEQPEVPAEN